MYDSEEEIKRKRRNLFIIIGVVAFLILLLLIFLFTRGKKKVETVVGEITCELEVKNGIKPSAAGTYNQEIEVGFKTINAISKDYQIIKQTVGTVDRSTNKETFSITKSGNYSLHGYVQDDRGNKGKCDLDVVVSMTIPTCELEVVNGVLGDNGWYKSDVEVGFKSMNANNNTLSIVKYYLDKNTSESNAEITSNIEKYKVVDNKSTTVNGYIVDSAGNIGTCNIAIMKDSVAPTCSLKVQNGTKNSNNEYTDNPIIVFDSVTDGDSEIAYKGVGLSKNYTNESFKVEQEGKTTVVGYVKDKAGNEGTCSLEINKASSKKQSNPTCKISLPSGATNNIYSGSVKVVMTTSTTNGASITDYGLAESSTYNGKTEITISNAGNHTVYGSVKDSYGNIGSCVSPSFAISSESVTLLSSSVQVGDYVNYDAGSWSKTVEKKSTDGYSWGYKSGTSRGTGVLCNNRDKKTANGWRVLTVSGDKVLLISAGNTECMYHGRTKESSFINALNSTTQNYINSTYAESASSISCNTPSFSCSSTIKDDKGLLVTGNQYWLATSANSNSTVKSVSASGAVQPFILDSLGVRPVIVLKSDVKTTGKKDGVWQLK